MCDHRQLRIAHYFTRALVFGQSIVERSLLVAKAGFFALFSRGANILGKLDEFFQHLRGGQGVGKAPQVPPKDSRRAYFKRGAAVKFYVLARAAGHCESCGKPAPFLRKGWTSLSITSSYLTFGG